MTLEREESLFEHYFEYGDSEEVIKKNLSIALQLKKQAEASVKSLADKIEDGEVINEKVESLGLEILGFSSKYVDVFHKRLEEVRNEG